MNAKIFFVDFENNINSALLYKYNLFIKIWLRRGGTQLERRQLKKIHQFKKNKDRNVPIPLQRNIRGGSFWEMEGGISEESSKITKAGIIDGHFSIDLSLSLLLCEKCVSLYRSYIVIISKVDNLFSVYTFYHCLTIFCRWHVLWCALYYTRYRKPFHCEGKAV